MQVCVSVTQDQALPTVGRKSQKCACCMCNHSQRVTPQQTKPCISWTYWSVMASKRRNECCVYCVKIHGILKCLRLWHTFSCWIIAEKNVSRNAQPSWQSCVLFTQDPAVAVIETYAVITHLTSQVEAQIIEPNGRPNTYRLRQCKDALCVLEQSMVAVCNFVFWAVIPSKNLQVWKYNLRYSTR